ncbi:hypothetical protein AcV7_005849 [Taiwanofungus camphoratus]|nr:hypothetical protein AcV7_005849 [Antrodia cinnamomea]
MLVGLVDDKGTVLYYEDSGVPDGSATYVTIVLVHGTMFHSAVFRRMIPYAASHNLRLVLLNCRDYPGSTRYTPAELDALRGPDPETQASAMQARGLEFAAFLHWFIETENIPPIFEALDSDEVRTSGGIALLGWSSGNCQTVPLLAHADKVPEDTRQLLDRYFRSFILHDTSQTAMGAPPLEGLYSPFRDETLSAEEKFARFPIWVSTYFTPVNIGPEEDSESPGFADMLRTRTAVHGIDDSVEPRFTPTVQRMSREELAGALDKDVMMRSQILIQRLNPAVYRENLRRALFDCYFPNKSGEERLVWPGLKVHVVWCNMTVGDGAYAAHKIMHQAKECAQRGRKGRSLEFHKLELANHFVHWDDPEQFTRFLADIV